MAPAPDPDAVGGRRPLLALLLALTVLGAFPVFIPSLAEQASFFASRPQALYPLLAALALVPACCAYLLLVLRLLRTSWQPRVRTIVFFAVVSVIPSFFAPPLASSDVYSYGYFGRLVSEYHVNPYAAETAALENRIREDPYYFRTGAPKPFSTNYGPLWTRVEQGVAAMAGENVSLEVVLFRLVGLAGLATLLVGIGLFLRGNSQQKVVVLLLAVNPFIIFESVTNAHNDIWVAGAVVFSLWLALRRRYTLSLLIASAGVVVKSIPLLVVPFVLVLAWNQLHSLRSVVRVVVPGLLLGAAGVLALAAPWWADGRMLESIGALNEQFILPPYHPVQVFSWILRMFGLTSNLAETTARIFGVSVFLLAVFFLLRTVVRRGPPSLVPATLGILAATIFLLFPYFQPWYFVWGLPLLILLLPQQRRLLLVFTVLGILTYTFY